MAKDRMADSSAGKKKRRSGIPTGNAGEYFVMGELLRRGYDAQLAPLIYGLGLALYPLSRVLVGISNVLLPGKGLPTGPFMSEEEIRRNTGNPRRCG